MGIGLTQILVVLSDILSTTYLAYSYIVGRECRMITDDDIIARYKEFNCTYAGNCKPLMPLLEGTPLATAEEQLNSVCNVFPGIDPLLKATDITETETEAYKRRLNSMEVIDKNEYISKLEVVQILQKAYAEGRIKAKDGLASVLDDINAADAQPIDKWINAKTNPPIATDGETSDYVLVLRASGMQCVCYYVYDEEEGNYWCSEDEKSLYDIDEITRWQPLPAPPISDTEKGE